MNIKESIKEQQNNGTKSMLIKNRLEKLFVEERKTSDRYGLHASSIIEGEEKFCYRNQLLSLFYEQNQGQQLPVSKLKIFSQGNATHEKWYKLFRAAEIDVAIERTLFLKKYDLSFTIDAIVNILGKHYICDIKTMNTYQFQKMKKPSHPSGEKQINFYMWALRQIEDKNIKEEINEGFVLIDDKNTQNIAIPIVEYNEEKNSLYIDRLKTIQEMKYDFLNNHIVPRRKCKDANCKRALECNMRDCCWNIGIGRVKLAKEKRNRR